MNKKLDDAFLRGKIQECARVLWIMDDERIKLRKGLEHVILVEAQRHAMQVKVRMAVTIFETLKMRMMAGDKPPDAPVSAEAVKAVDDLIAGSREPTKEKANGQKEEPLDQGSGSEPQSGM